MQVYIFVLVAIALNDIADMQTIRYFSTIAECRAEQEKIEPTINKDLVRLDCIATKVLNEQ